MTVYLFPIFLLSLLWTMCLCLSVEEKSQLTNIRIKPCLQRRLLWMLATHRSSFCCLKQNHYWVSLSPHNKECTWWYNRSLHSLFGGKWLYLKNYLNYGEPFSYAQNHLFHLFLAMIALEKGYNLNKLIFYSIDWFKTVHQ